MTIEPTRRAGAWEVTCNSCGEVTAYEDRESFAALIQAVKRDGFKINKSADGWEHVCTDCQEHPHGADPRHRSVQRPSAGD